MSRAGLNVNAAVFPVVETNPRDSGESLPSWENLPRSCRRGHWVNQAAPPARGRATAQSAAVLLAPAVAPSAPTRAPRSGAMGATGIRRDVRGTGCVPRLSRRISASPGAPPRGPEQLPGPRPADQSNVGHSGQPTKAADPGELSNVRCRVKDGTVRAHLDFDVRGRSELTGSTQANRLEKPAELFLRRPLTLILNLAFDFEFSGGDGFRLAGRPGRGCGRRSRTA